jgi:hypothetical protein
MHLSEAGWRMKVTVLFFSYLFLSTGVVLAGDTLSKFRLSAHAALLVNKAFSNISDKEERPDETSLILRTPSDSGSNARVGFSLGIDALVGKGKNLRTVLGLSFTRSGAEYHYSYLEERATSRTGFTKLTRNTEHDITETMSALNVQAGLRRRIKGDLFLTGSFLLTKPLVINRITNGYTQTVYSTNGPATETVTTYVKDEQKKDKRGEPNLSFRLSADYEFTLGSSDARVFLFRNFGIIYSLPWWGFGFAYTFKDL